MTRLKPKVEKALTIITMIIVAFSSMIDKVYDEGIPMLVLIVSVLGINTYILLKYGRRFQ